MDPKVNVTNPTRRQLITTGVVATAAAALGVPLSAKAQSDGAKSPRKRVLRIAHLTDIHLAPERNAPEGFAACLAHVQSQPDKADVIFTGGDTIMDSLAADEQRTQLQWDLWKRMLKAECSLPVESCIGNHDVWGLNKPKAKTTGNEPRFGKKWAMEIFGMQKPYRSFDRAGWHFIFLDSTFPVGNGYEARLDDEQFEWLASDLAATDPSTPVLLLSHEPILSVCVFFDGDLEKTGEWVVPAALMHVDARRIKDLFHKHSNVKVCLSGHIHLVDRADYLGASYLCGGAVSGAWWRGDYYECAPGYALVNLYADGTFDREYVTYGWKPPES